ncbi:uncharacterized protein [Anoplolepis gracilipes]|uniref:uncharacterized protein n=1 Tax=Anoplolepis gracilipes TaxID=354296 RepID=UPI003BA350AB
MECVWKYYYIITKKMLLLAGQWPYQKRRERLFRMTLIFLTELSILVTQVGRFIQCGKNLQCILTGLPTYLVHAVIIVKLLTCKFYSSKIKHLTDQLYSDWQSLKSPKEYKIMQTYGARARLISIIYSSYYYVGCPIFVLFSLTPKILDAVLPLNESRPVLLPHECHYFVNDDREYYYYIFFHVFISVFIVLPGLLAHDCMILTYIEHVCGIFAVAGFRLENLAHNTDIENKNINNVYNKKIALSVHAHWRALEFAEFLENTFCVTLVIQMFIVVVAMSVTLLQMAVQLENIFETTRYIAFISGELIHIFFFSLQGQRLIDHSLEIHDKIYNCFWYKIPAKSQRLLLNIMRKSLQPNFLSAGKIYIFSLKSFMTVIQSSVSYFTVLASFELLAMLQSGFPYRYRSIYIETEYMNVRTVFTADNRYVAKTMESIWNHYYIVTKSMLSFIGQWPYQKKRDKVLRMAVVVIIEISMLIPQVGKFIKCGQNVQCILLSIPTYLLFTIIMVKLLTCQFNSNKIKYLTDQLYIDWKNLESPEEYEIMKTYATKARSFSLVYSSYYLICVPLFVLISLTPQILDIVLPLNESRPILMPSECHYFVKDDRDYFYYIFFHTLISVIIIITALIAHDCVIFTYIEHVCGIFAVTGFRLKNLTYNTDIKNNNIDNVYNRKIALSVHAHWRALQFAEFLENTFSVALIIQMFIVIVALSVVLLQMTVQLENIIETTRYAGFVFGQLIHIFCFSLQGQRLMDHSLEIHDKIYNCIWYKIPAKSQRMLLNIMRRSLQPNFLTAGKIYIFSLKSFMTVIQSSVSYFTVLASFQ